MRGHEFVPTLPCRAGACAGRRADRHGRAWRDVECLRRARAVRRHAEPRGRITRHETVAFR